jgi:Flp pilus assembly protein TadD
LKKAQKRLLTRAARKRRRRFFGLLAAVFAMWAGLAGCRRGEATYSRIAVLPLENLTADPALDWMSVGLAEAVYLQIAASPSVRPASVASRRDADASRATHIVQGYFSRYAGRLRVEAVLVDAAAQQVRKRASASGPESEGALPLARSVAAQLEERSGSLGPANEAALKAYVEAIGAGEPTAETKGFEGALAADPDFGAAYVAWAHRAAARGGRERALGIIAAAERRGNAIPEVFRARLAALGAALRGDREGQYKALVALSRATPADADVFRALAELELRARRFRTAVEFYQAAAARTPEDVLLLNQLGYAQSWARDLEGALRSLGRYRELRPREPNPEDSLGDAHYYLGHFAEAEKHYLAAFGRDPNFLGGGALYKAAWARLMTGDTGGANASLRRFLEFRRKAADPLIELHEAEWEYLTGRRKQALERAARLAKSPPAPGAAAATALQLAVWHLDLGQAGAARTYAERAIAEAPNPAMRSVAEVCRFVAQPAAPAAELAARAERELPGPALAGLRKYAVAYALLYARDFAAAAPILRELHAASSPASPEPLNVLLAWCLLETKQDGEAGDLLETWPVPKPGADQPFRSLAFPRVFFLRGVLFDRQRRLEEAKTGYRLFLRLSGDLPSVFGEVSRAKAALTS